MYFGLAAESEICEGDFLDDVGIVEQVEFRNAQHAQYGRRNIDFQTGDASRYMDVDGGGVGELVVVVHGDFVRLVDLMSRPVKRRSFERSEDGRFGALVELACGKRFVCPAFDGDRTDPGCRNHVYSQFVVAPRHDVEEGVDVVLGTHPHVIEPVKEFTYTFTDKNGKAVGEPHKYTPKSFYDATVGQKLNGTFIMVMNDPRRPYYKTYEVEYDRHTYDGHNWTYLNLPMEEIAKLAIASIKDGHKMYSSYDVGKQLDRKRGYLDVDNFDYATLMGTTFNMNKADRISTFDSGSTHAMTLTAVDMDKNGSPKKWKVENSWGPTYGQKGCLIMTNNWFNEYMFRLVVNKKYITDQVKEILKQTPTRLPAWDPMFAEED